MAATGEVRVPETFGGRMIGSPEGAGARRVIFHSDMNAFYASVEQAERPELRGVPLVVGGHEELRHGIVLAKSAQAKAAGVKLGKLANAQYSSYGSAREVPGARGGAAALRGVPGVLGHGAAHLLPVHRPRGAVRPR